MEKILGLAVSNWMIWLVMAVFIVVYFIATEAMNKREEEDKHC